MHFTQAMVIGCVTRAAPKLKYDEQATPTYTFGLDVEGAGRKSQTRPTIS
jgi:hypothetical protein